MSGWRALSSSAFYQNAPAVKPFTYEDTVEAVRTLGKSDILELIGKFGVDYELNGEKSDALKGMGASEALISLIRSSFRPQTSSLEIRCNISCEMLLNQSRVGDALQKSLMQSGLKPGKYLVAVQASGFENEAREVLLQPGESSIQEFRLKSLSPAFGSIELKCEPKDCEVILSGQEKGITHQNQMTIKDLPPGSYQLEARSKGYRPATQIVVLAAGKSTIASISLEAEPPSEPLAPPVNTPSAEEAMANVLKALGSDAARDLKFKASGEMTLIGNKIPPITAHFVENVFLPGKIRWDLQIAGNKWTVIKNEKETFSNGDAKLRGSEFAQELERNIGVFLNFRLPVLLSSLRDSKTKIRLEAPGKEPLTLIGESSDERFTIAVDAQCLPTRILHEALSGLQLKTEFLYGRYQAGAGRLMPFLLTIRYPGQAGYGHELKYTSMEADSGIKEGLFKRSGFLKELMFKK
jgi:hypothetical protein